MAKYDREVLLAPPTPGEAARAQCGARGIYLGMEPEVDDLSPNFLILKARIADWHISPDSPDELAIC